MFYFQLLFFLNLSSLVFVLSFFFKCICLYILMVGFLTSKCAVNLVFLPFFACICQPSDLRKHRRKVNFHDVMCLFLCEECHCYIHAHREQVTTLSEIGPWWFRRTCDEHSVGLPPTWLPFSHCFHVYYKCDV